MGRPRKLYFGSWDGYPDCVYRCVARMHRKSVSDVMIYNREANGDVVFLDRWDPGLDVASIESMLKRVRGYRYLFRPGSLGSALEINARLYNFAVANRLPEGSRLGVGFVREDGTGHCVNHTPAANMDVSSGWFDPQSPTKSSGEVFGDVTSARVEFVFTSKMKKTTSQYRPY